MSVHVRLIQQSSQVVEDCVRRWNALARHPLQRWEWMGTWADHFVQPGKLRVLEFSVGQHIVGFAPWFIDHRFTTGSTLQFLGSGKACTDHQSLLVDPDWSQSVAEAAAAWLSGQHPDCKHTGSLSTDWECVEWIGVDDSDVAIIEVAEQLRDAECSLDVAEGDACYAMALPASWEDYIRSRSKSGRREVRQAVRQIDEGRLKVTRVETREQLQRLWPELIRLHQSRRSEVGTDGCFDYPRFASFLSSAVTRMLDAGMLRLYFAFADDRPVAAHLAFADDQGWYYYQSGMDPNASELRPGLALFCYTLREAIADGLRTYDLMRGDESYKLRWKASRIATRQIRVFNRRLSAQVRHQVQRTGVALKQWLITGTSANSSRSG